MARGQGRAGIRVGAKPIIPKNKPHILVLLVLLYRSVPSVFPETGKQKKVYNDHTGGGRTKKEEKEKEKEEKLCLLRHPQMASPDIPIHAPRTHGNALRRSGRPPSL